MHPMPNPHRQIRAIHDAVDAEIAALYQPRCPLATQQIDAIVSAFGDALRSHCPSGRLPSVPEHVRALRAARRALRAEIQAQSLGCVA